MFEFLKHCDQYNLYPRARDCELRLSAYDCITPIAEFFEIALKSHLLYSVPQPKPTESFNLLTLINHKQLRSYVKENYQFSDFDTIHRIRQISNRMKHDTETVIVTPDSKKEFFQCMFAFASGYYSFHTGCPRPVWNDKEYQQLLIPDIRKEEYEQLRQKHKIQVELLTDNLAGEKSKRQEAQKRILELEQTLDKLQVSETEVKSSVEKERKELTDEIERLKLKIGYNNRLIDEIRNQPSEFLLENEEAVPDSIHLTDRQNQAVLCDDKYIAVVAGPGSGKTRVLTERIASLVRDRNVPANRILALSFSTKAANEVQKRLKDCLGMKAIGISVRTFHSFGLSIVRQHADLLGYKKDIDIISSTEKYRILRKILEKKFIGYRQNREMTMADIQRYSGEISKIKTSMEINDPVLQNLCSVYNQELLQNGFIDFDDMIRLSRKLLTEFPQIRNDYKHRFDHVLIDEVQDVNPWQIDINEVQIC